MPMHLVCTGIKCRNCSGSKFLQKLWTLLRWWRCSLFLTTSSHSVGRVSGYFQITCEMVLCKANDINV